MRQTLGLISVLLTSAPAAAAGSRTVVLEGLDLPGHMAEYHDRTRTALEGVVRGNGREVVAGEGPRWCTTPDCFRAVARAADAGEVVTIRGGRNETEGFQLDLELRHADGELVAHAAGSCDVCSGPEMVALAEQIGRKLMATPPPATPPPVVPPLVATPAAPAGGGGEVRSGPALGIAAAAAGIAAAGLGAYLWHIDGNGTDCRSNDVGGRSCVNAYDTARAGIPLVIVGGAAAAIGTVLVIRTLRTPRAGVAVGPTSLALVGRF